MTIAWEYLYLAALLSGTVLAFSFTPIFKKIAVMIDFVDRPSGEKHKGHGHATPLLGGMAMLTAWIITIFLALLVVKIGTKVQISPELSANISGIRLVIKRLMFICFGAILAALLGALDDKYALKAQFKFGGQFLVAAIAVIGGGIKITLFFSNPVIVNGLAILWFVVLMNAINFFDNMDGLAVGTVTIAMALFTTVAVVNEQFFVAALGAVSCGVGLGFWYYNHNPASIFMGDSGSHFLGYLTAVLSSSVTYFSYSSSVTKLPVLVPMFILAVPLFDMLAVVVIRLRLGKPIYIGDHNHISHRFVRMGMSRKRAVQMVHLLSLIIGLSVLPLIWGSLTVSIICSIQAVLLLIMVTMLQYTLRKVTADTVPVSENKTT